MSESRASRRTTPLRADRSDRQAYVDAEGERLAQQARASAWSAQPGPAPAAPQWTPPAERSRSWWKVAGAVLGGLLVLGIILPSPDSTEPASTTATTVEAPGVTPEGRYIMHLASNMDTAAYAAVPDDELIEAGRSTCEALDQGASVEALARGVVEEDVDVQTGATVIAGAVLYLCPEHKGLLPS